MIFELMFERFLGRFQIMRSICQDFGIMRSLCQEEREADVSTILRSLSDNQLEHCHFN